MSLDAYRAHFAAHPEALRYAPRMRFDSPAGCWEMGTARYAKIGRKGARAYAHRVSLEIKLGEPLGDRFALHSCDNPPCCNPDHLRPGDSRENAADMVARGRWGNKVVYGLDNNKATLTDDEIVAALLRMDAGETRAAVAAAVGVTRRSVQQWQLGIARRAAHEKWLTARSLAGVA